MNVFKVNIKYKENIYKIFIQPSQTIKDLKFEIMKRIKVEIDKQFIYYLSENNQILLSNENTIEFYKIKSGENLILKVNRIVVINNYLNQKYFFKLKKNDKISDLKNKLINKFNLDNNIKNQKLYYKGKLLNDDEKLNNLKENIPILNWKETIDVKVNFIGNFYIDNNNNNFIYINVEKIINGIELKKIISERINFPVYHLEIYNDQNNNVFDRINFNNEIYVKLIYDILINNLDGKNIFTHFESEKKINELILMIKRKLKIENFSLLYNKNEIADFNLSMFEIFGKNNKDCQILDLIDLNDLL
jgi:hypothetical protein